MPVPYITLRQYEREVLSPLKVRRDGRGICYVNEQPPDRDRHGVLWMRYLQALDIDGMPVGVPEWSQTHPVRQRRASQQLLCQVCSLPARADDGCFFLEVCSGENGLPAEWPEGHVTTEPPLCPACLPTEAEQRRQLAGLGQAVVVMAATPRPYGVAGVLFSAAPSGRRRVALEETIGDVVPYGDSRIGWMLASRLALRLTDVRVVPPDSLTTARRPGTFPAARAQPAHVPEER
ncbi:hypothetical protein [Streptomyces hesseae]|uniref:Uncharacterized protein n=1 Tax=Streptomyces hesseae TaxID=3075519 RepID=A0ABU2SXQ0_9ACTN|nr:hypothetical protein [Streptomyces sp. DSM 40473]MDT0453776.1 hypothetical protein [Streptomyces sp. DSM 40473]